MNTMQIPSDKAFDTVINAFSIMLASLKNDDAKITVVHRVLGSLSADKLFEFEKQVVRMCDVVRGDDGTEVKAVRINTAVLDTYKKEQETLQDEEKREIAQMILRRQEALKAKKLEAAEKEERVARKAARVLAAKKELKKAELKIAAAELGSDDEDELVPAKVVERPRTLVARPYQSVTTKPTAVVLVKTNPSKSVKFVESVQVVERTTSQKLWVSSSVEYMKCLTKGIPMCLYGEDCAQVGCKDMHVAEEFVCQTPFGCKCSKIHYLN
jgi:hypothetical protein